jgi:heterodisulfide reductase subunit A-like polyferredoxin/coenzyme F420-reducing hydrogenase delta subunit
MTETIKKNARIGVFLCKCGGKIDQAVDLPALEKLVKNNPLVTYTEIAAFPCLAPGLKAVGKAIGNFDLDRIIVAGCEARILQKKFEKALEPLGIQQGQVEMVNLRDHVAQANHGTPEELAQKGARLIAGAASALNTLIPSPKVPVSFNGPVMVLGGGIATYSAAQELLRRKIDTIIAVNTDDPDDEIRMLHENYPGERGYHDRLRAIISEVYESPYIKKISVGELGKVLGRTGDYEVTFNTEDHKPPLLYKCGAIIAALDGQMLNQGSDFGHDGVRVVCQTELEEYLWVRGAPKGRLVFWINDTETPGRPWAGLAARAAWNMACFVKDKSALTDVTILHNKTMTVPLSAEERVRARTLGIKWVAYDTSIRPTVQSGYITYNNPEDLIEYELDWDMLCLSPLRSIGVEALKTAEILGLDVAEGRFLERNPQMVRPEQVGQDEKFLAGSARRPCDLREALRQGRRAAARVAELVEQAKAGELFAPRMVCTVDSSKCIGCGLCNEICDCGGIETFEGKGGNIPRTVDPMVCTGGGTCAAACPYQALTLQNNTVEMREARVAALVNLLGEGDAIGFGCNWGGGAAADHAGLKGLKHDRRFHLLPVGCIGQLDPSVLGRAFLEGANGLLLVGCPPEECHHSYGLDHTWSRVNLVKKLLSLCGIERTRVALAHADMTKTEQFVRTVNNFMVNMNRLGPINRDEATMEKIQALYDTLRNPRVRWVLGASLRRPYEDHYPSDQRNALAYDDTLSDVLAEEFIRVRVMNLLKSSRKVMQLKEISRSLKAEDRPVADCLKDLTGEGLISLIYKDRTPHYVLQ